MMACSLVLELKDALKARAASLLTPFALGDDVMCSFYGEGKRTRLAYALSECVESMFIVKMFG